MCAFWLILHCEWIPGVLEEVGLQILTALLRPLPLSIALWICIHLHLITGGIILAAALLLIWWPSSDDDDE